MSTKSPCLTARSSTGLRLAMRSCSMASCASTCASVTSTLRLRHLEALVLAQHGRRACTCTVAREAEVLLLAEPLDVDVEVGHRDGVDVGLARAPRRTTPAARPGWPRRARSPRRGAAAMIWRGTWPLRKPGRSVSRCSRESVRSYICLHVSAGTSTVSTTSFSAAGLTSVFTLGSPSCRGADRGTGRLARESPPTGCGRRWCG